MLKSYNIYRNLPVEMKIEDQILFEIKIIYLELFF